MRFLLTLIGFGIMLFAWFNPLELDMLLCVALFILGFDMMGIIMKILIFWVNFAFPVFGDGEFGEVFGMFTWTLLMLVLGEMVLIAIDAHRPFRLLVNPLIVFVASFISLGIQPALALAGTDLLINMTTKIKRDKKRKPKKLKKAKKEKEKKKGKSEKIEGVDESKK